MGLEDIGVESNGQFYLFKNYLDIYNIEIVFPRISYEIFNWMNYIGESEID